MSGKNHHLSPLESRKRLLIVESELNRALLGQEWRAMVTEAQTLARKAGIIGSWASLAASLAAGLAFWRRKKPAPIGEKSSWLQVILKGGQLAGLLWSAFRPPHRDPKEK